MQSRGRSQDDNDIVSGGGYKVQFDFIFGGKPQSSSSKCLSNLYLQSPSVWIDDCLQFISAHIWYYTRWYRYIWSNWLWFKGAATLSLWFLWLCLHPFISLYFFSFLFVIILHLFLLERPLNKPSTELRDNVFWSPDHFKSSKQSKTELLSDLVPVFMYFKEVWRYENVIRPSLSLSKWICAALIMRDRLMDTFMWVQLISPSNPIKETAKTIWTKLKGYSTQTRFHLFSTLSAD